MWMTRWRPSRLTSQEKRKVSLLHKFVQNGSKNVSTHALLCPVAKYFFYDGHALTQAYYLRKYFWKWRFGTKEKIERRVRGALKARSRRSLVMLLQTWHGRRSVSFCNANRHTEQIWRWIRCQGAGLHSKNGPVISQCLRWRYLFFPILYACIELSQIWAADIA
jgi:hypothetical protein